MLFLVAMSASAQAAPRSPPELSLRADYFASREAAIYAGIGLRLPATRVVRVEMVAAGGRVVGTDRGRASARADLMAAFLPSPASRRWAAYVAAGVSLRLDDGARGRGHLTVLLGAEAPSTRRVRPFLEAGVGGGPRVGGGVRFSRR